MRNCLTSKTDNHNPVHIGIAGKAGEHFLAHCRIGRHIGTAGVEDDIHSASDLACDNSAAFASACAGRQDQNMIADARSSLFSAVAPELQFFPLRISFGLFCAHDEVFIRQLAVIISRNTEQVCFINPFACLDVFGNLAQAFAVFDHVCAFGNIA